MDCLWGAVDGMDAVEKAVDLKPDVVLVDVSMPGLNGFEAAGSIHEQIPNAEILIVTEHDSRTLGAVPKAAKTCSSRATCPRVSSK